MPVTNVRLSEDFAYTMTTDARGRNSYAMQWIVDTDDQMMSPLDIANQSQQTDQGFDNPLPAFWSTYVFGSTTDPHAYFKGGLQLSKPNPNELKTQWIIEGTYEPLEPGEQSGSASTDPMSRPAIYHTESEPFNDQVYADKDGNPITNSAGGYFVNIPEEQGFNDVLVITKNYPNLTAVIADQQKFGYSVNSTLWLGIPARQAKIDTIPSGALITEGSTSFYRVSIRVVSRYKPWDKEYLDQGYMARRSPGLPPEPVEIKGRVPQEPVLLNADGTQKDPPGLFKSFRLRREVDYTGIELPYT